MAVFASRRNVVFGTRQTSVAEQGRQGRGVDSGIAWTRPCLNKTLISRATISHYYATVGDDHGLDPMRHLPGDPQPAGRWLREVGWK
jgi:hypothetical protein